MQEVEIKAKYTNCSQEELEKYLLQHGFNRHQRVIQKDYYYNHPARDFRVTDEALRIRMEQRENKEPMGYITYKGINHSKTGQNRLEIETTLTDVEKTQQILQALGFTSVALVHKDRTEFCKKDITLCLDRLEGIGTYIEIEKLIPETSPNASTNASINASSYAETEKELLALLQKLDFIHPVIEPATYLELVMRQS